MPIEVPREVPREHEHEECADVPKFRRLNYFYGQMLGAQDLQTEQDYFREKMKLHNRCLHGYGVICGLLVEPVPPSHECNAEEEEQEKKLLHTLQELLERKNQPNPPAEINAQIMEAKHRLDAFYEEHCKEKPRAKVRILCGMALDCKGNELVVRHPIPIDLLQALSANDYKRVQQGADTLYVSLCYCERPVDPVRPVLADACSASADCTYGKILDWVRVQVTVDKPDSDERCEPCCKCCDEECLLLAKIRDFRPGHPVQEWQIHNEVRRDLARYVTTKITGISWLHGHTYTQQEAYELLGTHEDDENVANAPRGLEIRFSGPVFTSTIHPGVVDVWVIEGGGGRAGNISNKKGKLLLPHTEFTDRIYYQDQSGEILEPGDRVLITVRTNFILDRCCQAVDGEHIGGRVPLLPEYAVKYKEVREPEHCCIPPVGHKPWTSGDGNPGGTFESWFFIRDRREVVR